MKNRFIASYAFNPDEEGMADFNHYLRTTDNYPARILVDVIEESFGLESIPHVGRADRKAVVRRLVEKRNRESADYSFFKVIDREMSGRRDDNILLSVLTNPGLLAPWLEQIEKAGVAISGVWSLPLISEKLIAKMGLTEGSVLLLTQQVPSNIRQSYFKDGKFKTSRSAGINLYEAPVGQYVADEVEQAVRYLANHRFIGFDEKINVHIICNRQDEQSIVDHCNDNALVIFHVHYVDEIEELTACDDIGEDYCNGVFSRLCKDDFITKSHYGPKNLFRFYYQQLTEKSLRALSMIILLASVISGISFVANTSSISDEIEILNKNSIAMEQAYKSQLQKLEPELKTSKPMMSSVLLYEKMLESKHISPQNFIVEVSKILSSIGMQDVTITKIDWKRIQNANKKPVRRAGKNKEGGIEYSQNSEIKHKVSLAGFIHGAGEDKKSASKKIDLINETFSQDDRFESVKIVKMALDMRSDKYIEDETGTAHTSISEDAKDGLFEIEMIMKGRRI
ncbi:MAG: hypothetical protein OQK76_04390 [Gammaproteobacteria bacterium]|nr:hypothetical protein [Gammaproteobacteria bacterium]MCW9056975.1 hypothetical protein [Gammaproteobacteria bacterium]